MFEDAFLLRRIDQRFNSLLLRVGYVFFGFVRQMGYGHAYFLNHAQRPDKP